MEEAKNYQDIRVFAVDRKRSAQPLSDLESVLEKWSLPSNGMVLCLCLSVCLSVSVFMFKSELQGISNLQVRQSCCLVIIYVLDKQHVELCIISFNTSPQLDYYTLLTSY